MMSQNQAITKLQSTILGAKFRERLLSQMGDPRIADKMANVLATEIARTPKLAQCDPSSVLMAALRCARYNLEPGEGLACLTPMGGRCEFQIEYKGMVLLMDRTGRLQDINTVVVHETDEFEYYVDTSLDDGYIIRHRRGFGNRGPMVAVYCVIRLIEGGNYHVVMDREEVEDIRDKASRGSQNPNSPWVKYASAMWRKTAIKQAAKVCPLTSDIVSADRVDDLAMVGVEQPVVPGVPVAAIKEMAQVDRQDRHTTRKDFQQEVATSTVAMLEEEVDGSVGDTTEAKPSEDKVPVSSPATRKKSTKNIEKDAYLEIALCSKGWDRTLALKKAQGLMEKDTVKLTAEDWKQCQQKIRDTSEEPLPDKPQLENKFKQGTQFRVPQGAAEEKPKEDEEQFAFI